MKDDYSARKERWARKMASQEKSAVRSTDRLPPGQRQVYSFPVLDLGMQPEIPLAKWELKIYGLVQQPVTLNWEQFRALPQFKDVSDFHCVTTWSQFDMAWEGVAFLRLRTWSSRSRRPGTCISRVTMVIRRTIHCQPAWMMTC